nr:hypothetical protein CFP56_07424 [Quercus suber]
MYLAQAIIDTGRNVSSIVDEQGDMKQSRLLSRLLHSQDSCILLTRTASPAGKLWCKVAILPGFGKQSCRSVLGPDRSSILGYALALVAGSHTVG